MTRPSFGWLTSLGLTTLSIACGAGGDRGGPNGAGNSSGAGDPGNVPGSGGAAGTAPTINGGPSSPLNGERPPPGTELPNVSDYGGPIVGFDVGRGVGFDSEITGHPACEADCQDFPAEPILEIGSNPAIFAQPSVGAGPCIMEPQDGVLIPANWTRPRINFTGGGDQHQIIVHADREANDLVVYTAQNPWIMPKAIWDGIRKSVYDEDITITVRTSTGGAPPRESQTRFSIAPVPAGGSIVFWASNSQTPGVDAAGADTTQLLGFSPGDEAVISTLTPRQVQGTILDDGPRLKGAEFGVVEGQVRCVGCHTSTPDGEAVSITDHWPWNNKVARISGVVGARPDYMTDVGDLLLQMPWQGTSTFSTSDWASGERRVITSYEGRPITRAGFVPDIYNSQGAIYPHDDSDADQLAWIDLAAPPVIPDPLTEIDQNRQVCAVLPCPNPLQRDQAIPMVMVNSKGAGWDIVERQGDTGSAVTPDWSHDGRVVAYTSASAGQGQRATADGHLEQATRADIYTVPFGEGLGGAAAPVRGAAEANFYEYYPDFSADDQFIAFNRVAQAGIQGQQVYYRPEGEIYVVPAGGGTAVRMQANDPPSCGTQRSPGVYNSWPKWSPIVRQSVPDEPYSGRTYYFYTFASARAYPGQFNVGGGQNGAQPRQSSQLYMGAMVVDRNGTITTYPALYLWNQSFVTNDGTDVEPLQMSNLTPAWDEFVVKPIVVVIQ